MHTKVHKDWGHFEKELPIAHHSLEVTQEYIDFLEWPVKVLDSKNGWTKEAQKGDNSRNPAMATLPRQVDTSQAMSASSAGSSSMLQYQASELSTRIKRST